MSKREAKQDKILQSVISQIVERKSAHIGSQDAALIILTRIEQRLEEQNELLRKIADRELGTVHEVAQDPATAKKKIRLFG